MDRLTRFAAAGVLLVVLAVAVGGPPGPDVPPAGSPAVAGSPPATGIPIGRPPDPAAAKLDVVLKQVRFAGTPVDQALGAIARQAGTNVVVAWGYKADHERQADVSLTDVTVRDAMAATLISSGAHPGVFRIVPHGGLVMIGDPLQMDAYGGEVRVYDVTDILVNERLRLLALNEPFDPATGGVATQPATAPYRPDYGIDPAAYRALEGLVRFIRTYADEGGWNDPGTSGGAGRIADYNGRLIITHTPAAHRHIESLLAMLRRTGPIPATRPAAAPGERP